MGKVKGSFLVETLIATVLISTVMLLFAGFLFNVVKAQLNYKYKIEANIESNKILDSLRYYKANMIEDNTWEKGQVTYKITREIVNTDLLLINCSAYFNESMIVENEVLLYDDN